jgi:hypothetical protein
MRILNYTLKNKALSRSGGILISSTACFLIGGLWVLGVFFHQPIVDFILSSTTSNVVVTTVVTKPIVFSERNTVLNLFQWKGDRFKSGHLF